MAGVFADLDDVRTADLRRVGGKAFNCARLKRAGFPVPEGLAIANNATEADVRRLPDQAWLRGLPDVALFAVRSSGLDEDGAGHSFAGIHETVLSVDRFGLVDAALACRRSGTSAEARAYREARGIVERADGIAVLVQRMVPAVISGVAFTINPISAADELVINAAPGLGDALVSGRVDADEFRIDKRRSAVLSVRHASARGEGAPTLSGAQLAELAGLLIRIETHYGSPQDVEWCHDGTRFWIVQSRPVTTVPVRRSEPEWTRANLAEVLPDQMSPQALEVYSDLLNRGQRKFMGRLLAPERELGPIFKAFRGRLYLNLSQMRRLVAVAGVPAVDLMRSVGHAAEYQPGDELPKRAPLIETLHALPDLVRIGIDDARAERLLHQHEREMQVIVARLDAVDRAELPDREIWDAIQWWLRAAPASIRTVLVVGGVMMREITIRRICAKAGFSYERLVYPQLAAGARSVSSQQAFDLIALADAARGEAPARAYLLANDDSFADYRAALSGTRFLDRFNQFLDVYGHRGRYESDWALPRLRENPAPALFAIREQLKEPPRDLSAAAARQDAEAADAMREFEARLTTWQRWTARRRVRRILRRLKQQYVWREQVRSDLTRVLGALRRLHLRLADRFTQRGWIDDRDDYFLLTLDEIAPAIADAARAAGLRAITVRRAAERAAEGALHMPLLMRESELPALLAQGRAPAAGAGDVLTGLCVSPGCVEAEVVVLRDPADFAHMRRGAILVAPATDPSWTPLFTLASGVIVEIGGMLSHASTIAREYGLPAIANVHEATARLKTGDRVTLDASNGRVTRHA